MEFVIKDTVSRKDNGIPNGIFLNYQDIPEKNEVNGSTSDTVVSSSESPEASSSDRSFSESSSLDADILTNSVVPKYLFPRRPGYGRNGTKMRFIANYFEMSIPKGNIYHYDVTITSNQAEDLYTTGNKYKCLSTKTNRKVMSVLLKTFKFFEGCAAFDGKKNLLTNRPLPTSELKQLFVSVKDIKKVTCYRITIKPVLRNKDLATIDLSQFDPVFLTKNLISEEAVMALDTILRHDAALSLTPIGRSFFYEPRAGDKTLLTSGHEIWFGYHQSLRISQWKPMLNIDISATTFHQSGPLLKYIERILNVDVKKLNRFTDAHIRILQKKLKSLKIQVNHLNYAKSYVIKRITCESAQSVYFILKVENRPISVAEYFRQHYRELQYPNFPCLNVGRNKEDIYLPLEVCDIVPGQHYNEKLNDKNVAEMIKHTTRSPEARFTDIMKIVRQKISENSSVCKEFGISISHKPLQLDGRVLSAPTVMYSQSREIQPRNGTWDIRGKQFFTSANIQYWAIISLSSLPSAEQMEKFAYLLHEGGKKLGMNIELPYLIRNYSPTGGSVENLITEVINQYPFTELIVFVLPSNGGSYFYSTVKYVAEIGLGLITQCIKDINLSDRKCNAQFICNLCQKINVKLGGINNILSPVIKPDILSTPVIIIGADCTHPSPRDKVKISVAALVGSLDNYPSRYATSVSIQTSKKKGGVEIIQNINEMMKDMFLAFYRNTRGKKPEKIIFYRDGLSEGEFVKAVNVELKLIRQACLEMSSSEIYQPPVTFIVVGKRHHTRFITENMNDGVGKHKNIPPGTVIDTGVTHPRYFDFYICSHTGIQGTSRPAHYTVLWDDNCFTADQIQTFSYYLCHTYARCTRSISIPCPVMYAHLAAYRAKLHFMSEYEKMGNTSDSESGSDLSMDQNFLEHGTKLAIKIDHKIKSSMYFV